MRRIGSVAGAGLLLAGIIGAPAVSADSAETYVGGARATALALRVGTTQLGSFGVSDVTANSQPSAKALGAGALSPLKDVKVEAAATGGQKNDPPAVTGATIAVPGLEQLLSLKIGTADALASATDQLPVAQGSGGVTSLDLDIASQKQLSQTIGQVQQGIQPLLGALGGGLDQVNKITGTDLKLTNTVNDLLTALGTTKTLAVKLGSSSSTATTTGATIVSKATAEAGQIDILPVGALSAVTGQTVPVASIIIGSASATATYDRATGKVSEAKFDPAIVTIRVNTPTTDALGKAIGINTNEIKITPQTILDLGKIIPANPVAAPCADAPQTVCILAGTPFESRVTVAGGRVVKNPDGTQLAVADGVRIELLKNITQLAPIDQLKGGIDLQLAHAEAGVGGQPAVVTPPLPAPDVPKELPRTGGTPLLPLLGAGLLAFALGTRRLVARAAR